jgi:hypothetical protein
LKKNTLKASLVAILVSTGSLLPVGNQAFAIRHLVGDVHCSTWTITGPNGEVLNTGIRHDTCVSMGSYFEDPSERYVENSFFEDIWNYLFRARVVKIFDSGALNNPHRANCSSNVDARYMHAEQDVSNHYLGRGMPAGRPVLVTYDDGSTEMWMTSNRFNSMSVTETPVEDTLECN